MKNAFEKLLLLCIIPIFTLALFACSVLTRVSYIEDFDALLYRLARIDISGGGTHHVPQIDGFTPIINFGFWYGLSFSGNYTYVNAAGYSLILRYDGTLFRARQTLIGQQIVNDKVVVSKTTEHDTLYGVMCIFGNIIAPISYRAAYIKGNTVLAIDSFNRADVFVHHNRIHRGLNGATLFSENILLINGVLYDLYLQPLTAGGFSVISKTINGMQRITDGHLLGFAAAYGSLIITPQFITAGNFNPYGYAPATTASGEYVIIDKNGNIIISQYSNLRPINFNGNIIIFKGENNLLGIADKQFTLLTNYRFINIYEQIPFSNSLIIYNPTGSLHRFFNLYLNTFLLGGYYNIQAFCSHFIAKCINGYYTLYDSNLRALLLSYNHIAFNGHILKTTNRGLTHYYAKQT